MSGRASIRLVSSTDDEKVATNHATWKFDLFTTVNSDPLCDGACLKVIVAYSNFAKPNERTAYLSENDLIARTGLDPRAIRQAKQIMQPLGYLTPIGKTAAGVVIYRLGNERKEDMAVHRVLVAEKKREDDALAKEEIRRRKRRGGCKSAPPKNDVGGADLHLTGGADLHPNTVEYTVERDLYEEGDSNRGWGSAYVRETLNIPDEGWPPLSTEERA